MITGGRNLGRVGTVVNRERHPGSFDIVHIKDANGHVFATRYFLFIIKLICQLFVYHILAQVSGFLDFALGFN